MKADYFHNRNRAADQGEKKTANFPLKAFLIYSLIEKKIEK